MGAVTALCERRISSKLFLSPVNGVKIIEHTYKEELKLLVKNVGEKLAILRPYEPCLQLVVVQHPILSFEEVNCF